MAAYAFARLRWPGRDKIFFLFLAALMVPPIFTMLPNFVLIKNLGLLNTFPGIILPFFFMTPFAIFFLRQFFLGINREIEEAAKLDGAGHWRIFFRIILPMSRHRHHAGILTFIGAWNEYFWPLLVASDENVRVLTVALGVFQSQTPQGARTGPGLMAADPGRRAADPDPVLRLREEDRQHRSASPASSDSSDSDQLPPVITPRSQRERICQRWQESEEAGSLLALGVAALSLTLTACGGGSDAEVGGGAAGGGAVDTSRPPATISYWLWDSNQQPAYQNARTRSTQRIPNSPSRSSSTAGTTTGRS